MLNKRANCVEEKTHIIFDEVNSLVEKEFQVVVDELGMIKDSRDDNDESDNEKLICIRRVQGF